MHLLVLRLLATGIWWQRSLEAAGGICWCCDCSRLQRSLEAAGGGRHLWHVGGPSGWAALRFLVGRFSGEAASGQGRVRRGAWRMGESSLGLPRIGRKAPCLGGGGVQRCGSGGCGKPRIRFEALCLGVGSSRCILDGGSALVVLR